MGPKLNETERKKRVALRNSVSNQSQINIGSDCLVRWRRLKEELQLKTNPAVAMFLLDHYDLTKQRQADEPRTSANCASAVAKQRRLDRPRIDSAGMSDLCETEDSMTSESIDEDEPAAFGHEDQGHHGDDTDTATHPNCHQIKLETHVPGSVNTETVNTHTTETECLQVKQETVNITQGGVPGYGVSVDSETKPLANVKQEADVTVARVLPVHGVSVDCGIHPDANIKQESSVGITSGVVSDCTHCVSVDCECEINSGPTIKQEPEADFTPGVQPSDGVGVECGTEPESSLKLEEPSGTPLSQLSGYSTPVKTRAQRHTGDEPFICTECASSFSHSSRLKRHMRTHSGERPFKCIECGAAFSHSSSLNRHVSTHTGEKLFTCTECSASFCRSGHVKVHMRMHTGEKSFECR